MGYRLVVEGLHFYSTSTAHASQPVTAVGILRKHQSGSKWMGRHAVQQATMLRGQNTWRKCPGDTQYELYKELLVCG